MYKVFVILFIALSTWKFRDVVHIEGVSADEANAPLPIFPNINVVNLGIIGPLQGTLDNLISIIVPIINAALSGITNVNANISELVNQQRNFTLSNIEILINATLTDIFSQFDNVSQDNFVDCTNASNINLLPAQLTNNFQTCANNLTATVSTLLTVIGNLVNQTLQDIDNFSSSILNCAFFDLFCYFNIIQTSTNTFLSIPSVINGTFNLISAATQNLTASLQVCGNSTFAQANNTISSFIGNITECIESSV